MRYFLIVAGIGLMILILVRLQNRLAAPTLPAISNEERYVPLGDSYTIGTGVEPEDSFPAQLTKKLIAGGAKIALVANPAQNGWTSQQLINNELPVLEKAAPTFTTVLIGVNDFNRGVTKEAFAKNLQYILDYLQNRKIKIIVITIPDFTVTPVGRTFGDPKNNSVGIAQFNKVVTDEAAKRKLPTVDVYPLTQEMKNDRSLVASDDLHPSAKEYAFWVEKILPVASGLTPKTTGAKGVE